MTHPGSDAKGDFSYQVLARQYRPQTFEALVGHEAMVTILGNAISQNRLAHAFLFNGIRGVGKTTTARLLALSLNCIGVDGKQGPSLSPCGQCEPCQSIAQSRHMDVIEMDAASHTSVDDIREIIESVKYACHSARFKIFIIDEIHMLSKSAFNALLKTLEEPPSHVKFIFATTEIQKIPVTILSRCQRFELKRIPENLLKKHYKDVLSQEKITIEPEALNLIVQACEGSVRDGLSLLEQAINYHENTITVQSIRHMLGWADHNHICTLMGHILNHHTHQALDHINELYNAGSDPQGILNDLLSLSHKMTLYKVNISHSQHLEEYESLKENVQKLDLAQLTRYWQILLKGIEECRYTPNKLHGAEMIIIRLIHASQMPTPEQIIKQLSSQKTAPSENEKKNSALPL